MSAFVSFLIKKPTQGESIRFRRVDEVQEADERAAIRFEPDPQPSLYPVVVTHYQQGQRIRRFPGTTSRFSCIIISSTYSFVNT